MVKTLSNAHSPFQKLDLYNKVKNHVKPETEDFWYFQFSRFSSLVPNILPSMVDMADGMTEKYESHGVVDYIE